MHPLKTAKNGALDLYFYIKEKRYDVCPNGVLVAIMGMFGKGKTLTAVHIVVSMYHKYNGKMVWCPERKKFVRQRINILSNVELKVPHEKLISMEQIIRVTETIKAYDIENDTMTSTLVIGDEFSVQMNSRNFKSNVDAMLLNAILTCRHHRISMYYTTQRFNLSDKLLRDVTNYVIACDKLWRFQRMYYYDAWELENAANTALIRPFKRACWFVGNKDYEAYDTLACVQNLKSEYQKGNIMTEQEILALRCVGTSDMDVIEPKKQSRIYKLSSKKKK